MNASSPAISRRCPCRLVTPWLLTWLVAIGPASAGVDEAEVEAAYLYNFSKFVHWPASAWSGSEEALVICVYGRTPPPEAMAALDGKSTQGHPVRVERRARGERLHACHIVYVSSSEAPYVKPLLRALAGQPTLTVSAVPGFAAAGGMIGLVKQGRRLRFEINQASAAAAGLHIGSQLLQLATRVMQP